MQIVKLLAILAFTLSTMRSENRYTMLCIGDSYTIGEAVSENERFPMQAAELLKHQGIAIDKPVIIAKTGWTTDELAAAIKHENLQQKFDFVTLLIGVNNQYRGRSAEQYRTEFDALLKTAIDYANGKPGHVFVISIPDWGVTPFAANDQRGLEQIGREIDAFNAVGREEAVKVKAHFIDITAGSREAKHNPELVATDGLHPSGKMYANWAQQLVVEMKKLTEQ